jgi:hypothetical protein
LTRSKAQHPEHWEDLSAGFLVELIEVTMYRVMVPDGRGGFDERWKVAAHASAYSDKTERLESVAHDWSTAGNLDDCFAKMTMTAEAEMLSLF